MPIAALVIPVSITIIARRSRGGRRCSWRAPWRKCIGRGSIGHGRWHFVALFAVILLVVTIVIVPPIIQPRHDAIICELIGHAHFIFIRLTVERPPNAFGGALVDQRRLQPSGHLVLVRQSSQDIDQILEPIHLLVIETFLEPLAHIFEAARPILRLHICKI